MRFIDIGTLGQVWITIFYIVAIILEICCITIGYMSKKKNVVFFIGLLLFSAVQMFMMIEILYELEWGVPVTEFTRISSGQNVLLTIFLLFLTTFCSVCYIFHNYRRYKREIGFHSIKEAFDTLPEAISIINRQGIPVLVNVKMYEFVEAITGKDFQSMDDIADLLNRKITAEHIEYIDAKEGHLILRINGKNVWQIEQRQFSFEGESYHEITASDITSIYRLSVELQEKNRELRVQKEQQEKLLNDMIRSKKEEEILNLKIDTHSKFGKAILATQLFLDNKNEKSPLEIWREVIENEKSKEREEAEKRPSSLHQLIDASQVFGCNILLDGELPKEEEIRYLIITAMREAITNAVRHAKADEIKIRIRTVDDNIKVEIEDNSDINIKSLRETGGLADLRKKIEKSGGTLEILCQKCVKMIVVLPVDNA